MTIEYGETLRRWRTQRRFSQLQLSARAGVSQRYLSFLETGRSRPSREMVLHLAESLGLPLRDRNMMLGAAGFAPIYSERDWNEESMSDVRHVLETLLSAHDPYPAYVVDGRWNLVMSNESARAVTAAVAPPETVAAAAGNALRLTLHPGGLRRSISNWPQAAAALLKRLADEVEHRPTDSGLRGLLDEVMAYPDVAGLLDDDQPSSAHDLLVPIAFDTPSFKGTFFTTISTIGAPFDVTLEELRLETLLPADETTESALRSLVVKR